MSNLSDPPNKRKRKELVPPWEDYEDDESEACKVCEEIEDPQWLKDAKWLDQYKEKLNEYERGFLYNMLNRYELLDDPSEKQINFLATLKKKIVYIHLTKRR